MAHHPNGSGELVVPSSFARLNYFYGQLLAQRDLTAEQSYHLMLRRLVQRETFGVGTVAGLGVDAAGPTTDRGVLVHPGLGMDAEGRELLVESDICVIVAEPARTPGSGTISGVDAAAVAASLSTYWTASIDGTDVAELRADLIAAGLAEVIDDADYASLVAQLNRISDPPPASLSPGATLRDFLFDALVATSYVGLRYLERGAEPAPAVLDASCCGESTCHPSRKQQGVKVVVSAEPLALPVDPYAAAYAAVSASFVGEENPEPPATPPTIPFPHACRRSLTDYLLGAWRPLPGPDACGTLEHPVVPLARVCWSRYAREVLGGSRILSADNHTFRPLAPGGATIHALFDVVIQCMPPIAIPPIFDLIEPADGAELIVEPAATEAFVRARATSLLDDGDPTIATSWQVDFYPTDGSAVERWDSATSPSWGTIAHTVAPNGTDPTRSDAVLTLTASAGPLALPAGTYVWRINVQTVAPDWPLHAKSTGAYLDGEPNPLGAVPSGDGQAGGTFEARFYVTGS